MTARTGDTGKHAVSTRDVPHGIRVRREDGVLLARAHDVPARALQQRRTRRRRAAARRAGRAGRPHSGRRGGLGARRARERRQQRGPPQRLRDLLRCGAGARSAEGGACLARERHSSERDARGALTVRRPAGAVFAAVPLCQTMMRAPGARRGAPRGARRAARPPAGAAAAARAGSRRPPPAPAGRRRPHTCLRTALGSLERKHGLFHTLLS